MLTAFSLLRALADGKPHRKAQLLADMGIIPSPLAYWELGLLAGHLRAEGKVRYVRIHTSTGYYDAWQLSSAPNP